MLEIHVAGQHDDVEHKRAELVLVARRARIVSWAIALCTTTALLVAALVAILFLGAFFGAKFAQLLTPVQLKRAFAVFLVLVAIRVWTAE